MPPTVITINGETLRCEVRAGDTLLDVLRGKLRLTAAKSACGRGECGACTVLVDGRAVPACVTLACCVDGPVETAEGLAEEAAAFRGALADQGGFQCSFCTPGVVVRAVSLLRRGLPPGEAELRREMAGNLCRCTGYQGMVEALRIAERAGEAPA